MESLKEKGSRAFCGVKAMRTMITKRVVLEREDLCDIQESRLLATMIGGYLACSRSFLNELGCVYGNGGKASRKWEGVYLAIHKGFSCGVFEK